MVTAKYVFLLFKKGRLLNTKLKIFFFIKFDIFWLDKCSFIIPIYKIKSY